MHHHDIQTYEFKETTKWKDELNDTIHNPIHTKTIIICIILKGWFTSYIYLDRRFIVVYS